MLTQIISSFLSGAANRLATSFQGFGALKFYFISTLLFITIIAFIFKDEIKQFDFNPHAPRECSNLPGLVSKLQTVREAHKLSTGYVVFIYQPKNESYYKSLVSTDLSYVKDSKFFKSIPLNAQNYLNYLLIEKEYAVLSVDDTQAKPYINEYGSDYILVYNVYVKETIAEVIFTFDVKPTDDEVKQIVHQLKNIKYYII